MLDEDRVLAREPGRSGHSRQENCWRSEAVGFRQLEIGRDHAARRPHLPRPRSSAGHRHHHALQADAGGCIPSSGRRLLSPNRAGSLPSPTGLSAVAAFTGPSTGRHFARADFHHLGRRRQDRSPVRVGVRAEGDVPSTPVNSSGPAPTPANTAPDRPTQTLSAA